MSLGRDHYAASAEVVLVGLARKGDRSAFAELVARRQASIRGLMRRCCGDAALADDLAQQVFLQAWRSVAHLQRPGRFGPWLKRLAINEWLQHLRKKDALRHAEPHDENRRPTRDTPGLAIDLDAALLELATHVRLCIVLSYHEGMTHEEIADMTGLPLGTVKSHIRRGTRRLRQRLSAYLETPPAVENDDA